KARCNIPSEFLDLMSLCICEFVFMQPLAFGINRDNVSANNRLGPNLEFATHRKRLLADPDRAQHLLKDAFVALELTLRSDKNEEQQPLGALQGDQPVGFTAPTCGGRIVPEIRRKRGVSIDTNSFVVADHAHVLVCLAERLDQTVGGLFQCGVRTLLPEAAAL